MSFINNFFSLKNCFAIDNSATDRAHLVAPRNDRFYANSQTRNYINFGGEYESDQNSKQYIGSFGHFYRSSKVINEIDFLSQKDYSQNSATKYRLKITSDLYDFQMSSKIIVPDSPDYIILFNRTRYNELSTYYYDITNAIGTGRMFFNDKFEFDIAIGQNDVKNYSNKVTFIPSFRAESLIGEKLRFIQRGFMFFSDQAVDYQSRTRFQYPINPGLYLQFTFDVDKRVYVDQKKNSKINEIHRRAVIGFRYDL